MKHGLKIVGRLFFCLCIILIANSSAFGDSESYKTLPFSKKIKHYDLTPLWVSKTIMIETGSDTIPRPEPLGFIGNDYHRFYIHFDSAKKNDGGAKGTVVTY